MPSSRITSRQNARVKDAVRLREARGRLRQGRIIIDGAREILRALEAGVQPVEAFVCNELCQSADGRQALEEAQSRGAELLAVSPDVFAKLAFGDRADGVVLIAKSPQVRLVDLQLPTNPLVVVVEGIEKPGNLGAILRSADAAGIDAVVVADGRTDLFNPNTIRASLGTVFRANVCQATAAETVEWLSGHGLKIIAARPDAETSYTEIDFRGGVAIALGSEALGLSDVWRAGQLLGPSQSALNVQAIRLPMRGLADSLNVSTTAAVLFYEALRQRC